MPPPRRRVGSGVMSAVAAVSAGVAMAAFTYLAAVSAILWAVDVRTHRLPNRVILPSYAVGIVLLVSAAALAADPARLVRALVGMLLLFAGYFLLRCASPTSLGGGDVKLAGLLGLYLGWLGWEPLLVATATAFLIGGVQAIILLARRRGNRRTRIPFGPAMIGGAWVAIAAIVLPTVLTPAAV